MSMPHLPVIVPVVYFLGALLIPVLARKKAGAAYGIAVGTGAAALVASSLGLAAVLSSEGAISYHLAGWRPPIGIELVLDELSAFVLLVVTGVTLVVLTHSRQVVETELPGQSAPFFGVTLLLLGGFSGIIVTGDLFNLYVFLEIGSLATYALLALGDRRAPVSAFRYLILGTIGASFYLLGLGFIFLETGSLNMMDIAKILGEIGLDSRSLTLGVILIVAGVSVKMALFPFHGWLPDAYSYASSAATSLIAPIATKVAAYVLIRFLFFVIEPDMDLAVPLVTLIGVLGALGILWGSIMAVAQTDLKRMLAYSSVGQIGYIGVGIGLASPLGLIGALLHLLNHACMKAGLFLVAGNFAHRLGHTDIRRLEKSVCKRMPVTSGVFAVAAISMIGLPPTAGFFSKWYLLRAGLDGENWFYVVAILLSSLLNAVYFFGVLERIYLRSSASSEETVNEMGERPAGEPRWGEVKFSMWMPTLLFGVGVLALGLGNVVIVQNVLRAIVPEIQA